MESVKTRSHTGLKFKGSNAPTAAEMKKEIQKAHFDFGYN